MSTSNQPNSALPDSTNVSQHIFDTPVSLNDFQVICQLSKGCFGSVYKVQYKKNGQIYAMKQYNKKHISKNGEIDFIREKSILYDITQKGYPNIVKLYADFEDNDTINLVMEYVEGITLKALRGNDNEQGYVSQNLINKCHIIHRDITPENIILQKNNQIKLLGFGISAYLENSNKILVSKKSIKGQMKYVPPEMLFYDKSRNYDYKIDIFSLGFTMYSLMNPTNNGQVNLPQITEKKDGSFNRIEQNLENKFYNPMLIEFVKLLYENDQTKRPIASSALEQLKKIQL